MVRIGVLNRGEDLAWISKTMLGHSEISTTLKFYAKVIVNSKKKHATFLEERTNNVQENKLVA